ncbi:MAG: hypothetical protein R2867_05635 [Caldilineaceae bacterium]
MSLVLSLPTVGPLLFKALIAQDLFLAGTILLVGSDDGDWHADFRFDPHVDRPADSDGDGKAANNQLAIVNCK